MGHWVVLELSSRGEQEDPEQVRSAISRSLKNADIFVPAAITQVGDDRVIHYLVEGYAFVRLDRQPTEYFKLEGSKFVQKVLVNPGSGSRARRLSMVGDTDILRMQDQIKQLVDQGIGIGDIVKITSGPYRNMRATVFEEIPEEGKVQVHIRLRSKQSLVTLPRSFLVVIERAPLSSVGNRLTTLSEWMRVIHPIFKWNESFEPVLAAYEKYSKVEEWNRRGYTLFSMLTFDRAFPPILQGLQAKLGELSKYTRWQRQGSLLFTFVAAYQGSVKQEQLDNIEAKYLDLLLIEDFLERIRVLWEQVEVLSRAMSPREGKAMVHNVIVDGHNLAFRCLYAPGISELTDSKGRPTGVILGFLRSLGSLKKRFPDASIHITWDGSSRRRKARYNEYKANRASSIAPEAPSGVRFDPILVLKDIIPLFGIRQFWNPEEEADDVIATLVRSEEMSSQNNVIFSTDKDLLQLVTSTTSMLMPATGSRNEILFDDVTVMKTLGVVPEKVTQLRALYGDTSDNIPGVPRVPKKILRALVQAHGSIDGLYRSGLAGVSKGQYERLRSAEPQVRINLELMALVDVAVTTTPADVDPDNVAVRLREMDIDPTSLLETFFGSGHRS